VANNKGSLYSMSQDSRRWYLIAEASFLQAYWIHEYLVCAGCQVYIIMSTANVMTVAESDRRNACQESRGESATPDGCLDAAIYTVETAG